MKSELCSNSEDQRLKCQGWGNWDICWHINVQLQLYICFMLHFR